MFISDVISPAMLM